MSGFVYMWINKVNNKKYVGSHIGTEDDGYIGSGVHFQYALNKYGIDNFERIILERIESDNEVREREEHYLKLFNVANDRSFYNIRDVAGGGFEHINNNPDLKKLYSEQHSALMKCKIAENGHPKGMSGKKHTPEHRAKLLEYAKKHREESKRPVLQYDLDGNLVAEHESLVAAARAVRGGASNIKYSIEGKFKTSYKHVWKYKT